MKLTKTKLRKIIKEEIELLKEEKPKINYNSLIGQIAKNAKIRLSYGGAIQQHFAIVKTNSPQGKLITKEIRKNKSNLKKTTDSFSTIYKDSEGRIVKANGEYTLYIDSIINRD